jgi:oligopeptide transport system permease protein
MAAIGRTAPTGSIVNLQEKRTGEGLWAESFKRLRRNKAALIGAVLVLLNLVVALTAPYISPHAYDRQTLTDNNAAPLWVTQVFPNMRPRGEPNGYVNVSDKYFLGADNLGRDLWTRILWGSRVSLGVALVGSFFSITVGIVVGLLAGYAGGKVDTVLMRLVDIMYAFPTLLLIILLMAFFRVTPPDPNSFAGAVAAIDKSWGGTFLIFIGIGATSWMQMARLVRGQVLSVRQMEYVEAAKSIGASNFKTVMGHIFPNILGPLLVAETLSIPSYISYEAFLSFIGLGVMPPLPSWGGMIAEGARAIGAYPNQAIFPALALFVIMFAFNFLGDGLRDALDPRMRGRD